MNEVANLVKAIRAIPSTDGKPWNPRVAVETFVQHALMSLGIYHVKLVAHIDPKVLAFTPLQERAVAVPEVGAAGEDGALADASRLAEAAGSTEEAEEEGADLGA